jgi:hypothetical protein
MRELTSHKVNPANDQLTVTVNDGPGPGGASHNYSIEAPSASMNLCPAGPMNRVPLNFQNGPINEVGVNGITHEALLAILIDRLEGFQSGKFANDYNASALDHLKDAAKALHARTLERMNRGVEGTHAT